MRTILVGEVRTGRRITQIPVADCSWSMTHRDAGEVSVSIPLGAADFAKLEAQIEGLYPSPDLFMPFYPTAETRVWRAGDGLRAEFLAALEPVRCWVAVCEGDAILEAAIIWRWEFDARSNVLTVGGKGLWSLLDYRFVNAATSAWAEWAVTYSGLSLGTIAKRLVELTTALTDGELPIDLPDDEVCAGDEQHTRVYQGYDLATVRERITQLMQVEGGPDIAFEPHFTADRKGIRWSMRTGTDAQPLLTQPSGEWVWDDRVPQSSVSGISVVRDASDMVSRAWAIGAGSETALMMTRRDEPTLTAIGFPMVEGKESHSDVTIATTLDRWAESMLSAQGRPRQTWTMTVRADAEPKLGAYRPGDWAKVWVSRTKNPLLGLLLEAGFYRTRILNISGDMGNWVDVTMMPVLELR